jgi:hypothetical protein
VHPLDALLEQILANDLLVIEEVVDSLEGD